MRARVLVGPGGGLKNVFVYVKDGLGNRTYAVPTTPVMLDQKGCKYVPHVFGVQAGQTVQMGRKELPAAAPGEDFRLALPLPVPPGRYQLRLAVKRWMRAQASSSSVSDVA